MSRLYGSTSSASVLASAAGLSGCVVPMRCRASVPACLQRCRHHCAEQVLPQLRRRLPARFRRRHAPPFCPLSSQRSKAWSIPALAPRGRSATAAVTRCRVLRAARSDWRFRSEFSQRVRLIDESNYRRWGCRHEPSPPGFCKACTSSKISLARMGNAVRWNSPSSMYRVTILSFSAMR